MSAPLHTLQLDTGRDFRGGQRQVALLARGLAALGHRVDLVVPPAAPLAGAVRGEPGIHVHEIPMRGEIAPRAALALARLLRRRCPVLVHAHTAHGITLAHVARRIAGSVPLVAHRHVAFARRRNALSRWKRRWPDLWVAVSEAVAARLRDDGIPAGRIVVVPAALDPDSLAVRRPRDAVRTSLGIAPDDPLIVFLGALTANKNPGLLLDAAARLVASGRRLRLLLVGAGPLREPLEDRARNAGIGRGVVFAGEVRLAADLLAAGDLAVFPSRSEGSHSALKEAMALGVPLLASRIPAHLELGLPEDRLFDPEDAEGLATRIAADLDDLPGARAAATRLVDLTAGFRPERMVERTLCAYRGLLAPGGELSH